MKQGKKKVLACCFDIYYSRVWVVQNDFFDAVSVIIYTVKRSNSPKNLERVKYC